MRFVIRALRRALGHPASTAVAVLSLALGIAVLASIFAFVDAIVLRPLPVADRDRLGIVAWQGRAGDRDAVSVPDLAALEALDTFASVGGWANHGTMLGTAGDERLALTAVVSEGFFATLRTEPLLGRLPMGPMPARPGTDEPSAVLGFAAWRRHFAGDAAILGRSIVLNRRQVTVVGVLPGNFQGLERHLDPEVWLTIDTWQQLGSRAPLHDAGGSWLQVVARLAPGVSVEQAAARLAALTAGLRAERPGRREADLVLTPLSQTRPAALVLVAGGLLMVAALVLAVACANMASLLVARGDARRRELAIRAAIGASRAQLVRQLMSEAAVVGVVAAVAAIGLSQLAIGALPALMPDLGVPLGFDFRYDARGVAVTVLATLVAVIGFGLAPALRHSRGDLVEALAGGGWHPVSRLRVGDLLVAGQMAVCLCLLLLGGLLVQSLRGAGAVDLGMARQPALLVQTAPAILETPPEEAAAQRAAVAARVEAMPGVRAVSWTRRVPLSPNGGGAMREIAVAGHVGEGGRETTPVRFTAVGEGYFDVMGTVLRAGREFGATDDAGSPGVAVVNEAMARHFWGRGSALGQRFRLDGVDGPEVEVVGVAADGRYLSLEEAPTPYLFLPLAQAPAGEVTLIAALVPGAQALSAGAIREAFRSAAPGLPVVTISSLEQHLEFALFAYRLSAGMLAALGGLALLLAVVGLHAVVAQHVGASRRAIGIRLAIGARRGDVLRVVLGRTALLMAIGAGVGMAIGLAIARLLSSVLVGTSPYDPLAAGAALAALLAAAAAASLGPSLRALRVDPVETLRAD